MSSAAVTLSSHNFDFHVQSLATPAGWAASYPILESAGELAIPAVLRGMANENADIRRWCTGFLDHHATPECVPALIQMLHDPVADVRRLAVHAVGCQACKATPLDIDIVGLLTEQALQDSSVRVRRAAVHMLGNQAYDGRAVETLERILAAVCDTKTRKNAEWALSCQHKSQPLTASCRRLTI